MLKKTALFLRVGFPYNLYLDSLGYDRTPCLLDSLDNPEACSLFLCGHREQDLRCSLSCRSFLCVFGLPHKIANTCSRSPILSNLVDLGAFERAFLKKKVFALVRTAQTLFNIHLDNCHSDKTWSLGISQEDISKTVRKFQGYQEVSLSCTFCLWSVDRPHKIENRSSMGPTRSNL